MKKYIPVLVILLLCSCKGQNQFNNEDKAEIIEKASKTVKKGYSLIHKNLSDEFNYQSFIQRIQTNYFDSCLVKIVISDKSNGNTIFQTNITSTYLLGENSFENDNVRSFITGKNVTNKIVDNDFGDMVVADFNFDSLEDFAIKREEGGNSGPFYNFYIQSGKNQFILDKYLSDTMIWLPNEINEEQNILKTLTRVSTVSTCKITHKYNSIKGIWKEENKEFFGE
jgi:hypothetical protein